MDDSKIILKKIEEKYDRFMANYAFDSGDFHTLEEQSIVSSFVKSHEKDGVMFFGGYEDAERKQVLFIPDYMNLHTEKEVIEYFSANPEDSTIDILDLSIPKGETRKLGHRDYLGAYMSEGLKREIIGDILISDTGAQIIVKKEMSDYLLDNFRQAGHVSLVGKILPLSDLNLGVIHKETVNLNVPSVRLDNVVSEAFKLSRKDAVEAITRGIVFVNGIEKNKPDYKLGGIDNDVKGIGDKIVLRGKGKIIYHGIVGQSKKGNLYIEVIKYI